jgi:hypothetical protein
MLNMSKLMPLAAIWLNDKVTVETEEGELLNTLRITKGMHVYIAHGTILDCTPERSANASILELLGDIYSTQLEIELIGNDGSEYKLILK